MRRRWRSECFAFHYSSALCCCQLWHLLSVCKPIFNWFFKSLWNGCLVLYFLQSCFQLVFMFSVSLMHFVSEIELNHLSSSICMVSYIQNWCLSWMHYKMLQWMICIVDACVHPQLCWSRMRGIRVDLPLQLFSIIWVWDLMDVSLENHTIPSVLEVEKKVNKLSGILHAFIYTYIAFFTFRHHLFLILSVMFSGRHYSINLIMLFLQAQDTRILCHSVPCHTLPL